MNESPIAYQPEPLPPPGRDDVLVVAEPNWAERFAEEELQQVRHRGRIWRLDVQPSGDKEKPATVMDLFGRVSGLDCVWPKVIDRAGGTGGIVRIDSMPLAQWPLFRRVVIQCDWLLDGAWDEEAFTKDWWRPLKRMDWNGEVDPAEKSWWDRVEHDELKSWAANAVLPAGLLLLSMIRHEYSIDERMELVCVTGRPWVRRGSLNVDSLTTLGAIRRSLDSNERIRCVSAIDREPVRCGRAQPDREAVIDAEWQERLLRACLLRAMWGELLSEKRVVSGTNPLTVIFCDDNPNNVKSFIEGLGMPCDDGADAQRRECKNAQEGRKALRYARVSAPESVTCNVICEEPHKWDEKIRDIAIEVSQVKRERDCRGDPPIFVLCDYDLATGTDSGRHEDVAAGRGDPHGLEVPVTGAKLSALAKGHLSREFPGRSISAIAFSGGVSPVIAQECIGLGCDFVIRKDGAVSRGGSGGAHVSADVGGLSSLTLWVWTIACHHRFLVDVLRELRESNPAPDKVTQLLEASFRAVVRRDISVPRSLQPRLDEVREEAMGRLGSSRRARGDISS